MNEAAPRGAVIVTGAAQGIGFAIAQRFARDGRRVAVADRHGAHEAAARLGGSAFGVEVDVGDARQVDAMVDAVARRADGIAVLVNNAGIYSSLKKTPFEDIDRDEWQRVFAVNVEGVWHCCRAVSPHMRRAGAGAIVNIASASALKGNAGLLHYVASKGAVIAMTRVLARELGPSGIRVNTVSPGFTQSDGILADGAQRDAQREDTRRQRIVQRDILPDDIAGTVVFLAGPDAGMFAGQHIVVDGGMVML